MTTGTKKHPCAGCAYRDESDNSCANSMKWLGGIPADPFCKAPLLYKHIGGEGSLYFEPESTTLVVENEARDSIVFVKIGRLGLLELAAGLISEALKLEAAQ